MTASGRQALRLNRTRPIGLLPATVRLDRAFAFLRRSPRAMPSRPSGSARATAVVACAAVALIGGGAWWLLKGGGGNAPQLIVPKANEPTAQPLAAPAESNRIESVREEVAAPAPVAVAAGLDLDSRPPPESFTKELSGLKGRLVEEDGTPIGHLQVDLLDFEIDLMMATIEGGFAQPPPRFKNPIVGTTKAGADGRFVLTHVESGNINLIAIDLGGGRGTVRLIEKSFARGEDNDLGDIALPPHVTLVGKVADDDGNPIAGARIRVLPELPNQFQIPPQVLQMGITDIRSDSALLLSVQETITTRFAMPGPMKFAFDHLPIPTGATDSDGAFRIAGVPAGLVTVMADKPGFMGNARAHKTGKSAESNMSTLGLQRGLTISGQLLTGTQPLAGANVMLGARLPLGQLLGAFTAFAANDAGGVDAVCAAIGHPTDPTDSSGGFRISGLPDFGEVMAAVQRRPGDPWRVLGPFPGDKPLKLDLGAETTLQLAVADAADHPVSGVEFRFRETGPTDEFVPLHFLYEPHELKGRVTEVEPGKYLARELPVGEWTVLARAPGYGIGTTKVKLTAEGGTAVLKLGAAATVVADVRDAAGAPVDYALVTALAHTGGAFVTPFTAARADAEGKATLPGIPADEPIALRARHPGFTRGYAKVTPEQIAAGLPVPVLLLRGGDFVGRVTTQGEPPAKPLMLVLDRQGDIEDVGESEMPSFGLTAADGSFAVRHLPAGGYRYMVYTRFLSETPMQLIKRMMGDEPDPLAEGRIEILEGQETRQEIEALPDVPLSPATLRGTVRVAGQRVEGAHVQLSGRRWNSAECDARGEFVFAELRPGQYQIEITRNGERGQSLIHRESITLGSGEVRQLDVDARLTQQAVAVHLADGTPAPNSMVNVVAVQSAASTTGNQFFNGSAHVVPTNDQGEAVLELPAGSYKLIAVSEEHGRGTCDCTVGTIAGKPLVISLVGGVPCAGKVILDGVELAANADESQGQWHLYLSPVERSDDTSVGLDRWMQVEPPEFAFAQKNLVPGRYRAMVWGPSLGGQQVEFDLPERGATDLVLRFDARKN